MLKSLDILIPTRDRPERLIACLASIAAQELGHILGPISLYILDNGSVSCCYHTEVVRCFDALLLRGIKPIYLRRPDLAGIFWIRRELYRQSSGEVVFYVDDDLVLAPSTISTLWQGIAQLHIHLTAGFIVDIDNLFEQTITFAGHILPETITWLIRRLQASDVAAIADHWIEMLEPIGACLMFQRKNFEQIGAWEKMRLHFEKHEKDWAEDTGLCVALKSLGSAFVSVHDIVMHFTPQKRYFAGFEPSESFKKFLIEHYTQDYPDKIKVVHELATFNTVPVIEKLQSLIKRYQNTVI